MTHTIAKHYPKWVQAGGPPGVRDTLEDRTFRGSAQRAASTGGNAQTIAQCLGIHTERNLNRLELLVMGSAACRAEVKAGMSAEVLAKRFGILNKLNLDQLKRDVFQSAIDAVRRGANAQAAAEKRGITGAREKSELDAEQRKPLPTMARSARRLVQR